MSHQPTPRASSRQLRAILFADIAGYTAMMQEDEAAALQQLGRFKAVLEEQVPDMTCTYALIAFQEAAAHPYSQVYQIPPYAL